MLHIYIYGALYIYKKSLSLGHSGQGGRITNRTLKWRLFTSCQEERIADKTLSDDDQNWLPTLYIRHIIYVIYNVYYKARRKISEKN